MKWKMKWELGTYRGMQGYIGIMEKKMETTIVYWDKIEDMAGLYEL